MENNTFPSIQNNNYFLFTELDDAWYCIGFYSEKSSKILFIVMADVSHKNIKISSLHTRML